MPHLLLKELPRYECLLESAKEFPELDPSATEAFLHLLRTSDEAFAVSERSLAAHSISQGRFCVLMLLWRSVQPRAAKLMGAETCASGPRTPAELADAAGVTRATMTGLIDTLERDGYVKRDPDLDDRRMMSVRLTPKAEDFLRSFLPEHFKVTAALMATLTEPERKTLVRLLTKISQQANALTLPAPAAMVAASLDVSLARAVSLTFPLFPFTSTSTSSFTTMLKKFLFAVGGFIVVFLTLGAVKSAQIKKMASTPHTMPATAVSTSPAEAVEWHSSLHAIGTLAPVQGIMLSADADGAITRIAVESGAAVKTGDVLLELDTTVEVAQLAAADARAELAQATIDRTKELWDSQAISKSEFDVAIASAKQAVADVAALKAQIAKKQIRAPFDGRVGIRLVNVGQFIGRGAPLMPLQQADPIYVNFSVPQRNIPSLALGQKVTVTIDSVNMSFEATLTAINSEVDDATRNVSVQATLPNPKEQLRAGMFVQVSVEMPKAEALVVVPATAIAYASYGNSVFIVEQIKGEDGHEFLGVRQQFVKLGAARGDVVAITEGVKAGEQVVSAGVFKLRNGVPVQVNNDTKPAANPDPTPRNS